MIEDDATEEVAAEVVAPRLLPPPPTVTVCDGECALMRVRGVGPLALRALASENFAQLVWPQAPRPVWDLRLMMEDFKHDRHEADRTIVELLAVFTSEEAERVEGPIPRWAQRLFDMLPRVPVVKEAQEKIAEDFSLHAAPVTEAMLEALLPIIYRLLKEDEEQQQQQQQQQQSKGGGGGSGGACDNEKEDGSGGDNEKDATNEEPEGAAEDEQEEDAAASEKDEGDEETPEEEGPDGEPDDAEGPDDADAKDEDPSDGKDEVEIGLKGDEGGEDGKGGKGEGEEGEQAGEDGEGGNGTAPEDAEAEGGAGGGEDAIGAGPEEGEGEGGGADAGEGGEGGKDEADGEGEAEGPEDGEGKEDGKDEEGEGEEGKEEAGAPEPKRDGESARERAELQRELQEALAGVLKGDVEEASGTEPGEGFTAARLEGLFEESAGNPQEQVAKALARLQRQAPQIHKVLDQLGRMMEDLNAKEEDPSAMRVDDLTGIEQGGALHRVLPPSLVRLGHPLLRRVFLKDLIERRILQYQLEGKVPRRKRGGMVILVDHSYSMKMGQSESGLTAMARAAGAAALAVIRAAEQKRPVWVISFDDTVTGSSSMNSWGVGLDETLSFLFRLTPAGGTSFDEPLRQAMEIVRVEARKTSRKSLPDILLVTDGLAALSHDVENSVLSARDREGLRLFAFSVNGGRTDALGRVCDQEIDIDRVLAGQQAVPTVYR